MPVPEDVVASAIRLLLDREPVGGEALALAAGCRDVAALRRELLASDEFERLHPDLARTEHPAPVIVPVDEGVRIVVDLSDHAVGVPIARRAFERNELDFVRRTIRPGQHVIDGGAHAGLYTVTMAQLVGPAGSVEAFEPIARHAAWLESSVGESGVRDRVRIHRTALADRSAVGEMVTCVRSFSPGAAWLRPSTVRVPSGYAGEQVQTVALDDLEDLRRPVAFVRLDVEAAEGLVLRGAPRLLAADRPVLLVEVHVDRLPRVSGLTSSLLLEGLRALGYRLHALSAGEPGARIGELPAHGTHPVVCLP
jgi:FkbM family methyltransferase